MQISKILLLTAVLLSSTAFAATTKKVLISQVVEHPALNATTRGIKDALKSAGYEEGKNLELRVESAQANVSLAGQIASKFINQEPDVVVGVGTISAQSFSKYAATGKVKLIFSSVTDPVSAGLVKSLKQPGNNTSGVSNFVALEPQLELFKKLQPKLNRLGIIYNPGEVNSVSIVNQLETLTPKEKLTLVKQSVTKTADVAQNAVRLAENADAIYISNDNTALSSLQSVIKAAQNAKIPVYVSDTDAVEQGAVAALGPNQYEIGLQTGKMIVAVLKGADVNTLPVEFPDKTELYLNLSAAKKVDIVIPEEIVKTAAKVIK